jgi:hypothetical protein
MSSPPAIPVLDIGFFSRTTKTVVQEGGSPDAMAVDAAFASYSCI